jgi:hypothetical protein
MTWAISFMGFLALATPAAYPGEIADCAHDRFLEAYASPKTDTIAGMIKASRLSLTVCLGDEPSWADQIEFNTGVDRAFDELWQRLHGRKL